MDGYSSASMNSSLLASLSENKLERIYGSTFDDDNEASEPGIKD